MVWWILASCKKDDPPTVPDDPSPLLGVSASQSIAAPGADGEAWIVRTPHGVPYVYATTEADLARATGFVTGRDRYFVMDMARRLAEGRLAELLGNDALATDLESRGMGMTRVADGILSVVSEEPALAARFDAYAEGINLYVAEARAGRAPVPSEIETLGPLLGAGDDPAALMTDFERRDIAAIAATLVYNLGFETTDVGRSASWDAIALGTLFDGQPGEALREAGVRDDIFLRVEPTWPVTSSPGWGAGAARRAAPGPSGPGPRVERAALRRLERRLERFERRLGHDHDSGFGSNAWAVAGTHTADGRALLAGDGHLSLSIPSLFYPIGLDTAHLGGGETHQVGLVFPGFPTLAVGTNGRVAWGQTQLMGDITDWYAEHLVLDGQGRPAATVFGREERALAAFDEAYEVRDVPVLGSTGRSERWTRYETFDGRLLVEIEGTPGTPGETGRGRTLVAVGDAFVFPEDTDHDGVITAFSVDHTAFDRSNLVAASDGFGHAQDVEAFRAATRKLVAYSQNLVAADADGHVLYTPYQAVPCRGYLPRNPDGTPEPGADPSRLLDGTKYRGFTIPVTADWDVDESKGAADPYQCVVPFDEMPVNQDPPEGYVFTANNDIGDISLDGDLWNDPWYVGGPWLEGYRARRIQEQLDLAVAGGAADPAAMARLQGDHHSVLAEHWLDTLLTDLDAAGRIAARPTAPGSSEERLAAAWNANEARIDEARTRLEDWRERGLSAASGVETFYDPLAGDDAADSVATMIFNAWIGVYVQTVFDDEGFPGVFYPTGDTGRTRTLTWMLEGRGPGNPMNLASWDPAVKESIFFDVKSTPERETSRELAVTTLVTALDTLSAPNETPGYGGFGTADMDEWRWGLRHLARMESILAEFLSAEDGFGFLIEPFSVSPALLPLADDLTSNDPRWDLPFFPRDGDHLNVDAGNPGFDRSDWTYGSGPVFRMVVSLGPDGWSGENVIPGGQSGVNSDATFADQAALWLANETYPMLTSPDEVAAVATERVVLHP